MIVICIVIELLFDYAVASLVVTQPRPRYRVIQWGTGAVGTEMITAILDHRTDLDLAGAKVHSDSKHGKDVGELVGHDPVGVLATTDTAEVLALEAECVLYTPRTTDLDEVCSILASDPALERGDPPGHGQLPVRPQRAGRAGRLIGRISLVGWVLLRLPR